MFGTLTSLVKPTEWGSSVRLASVLFGVLLVLPAILDFSLFGFRLGSFVSLSIFTTALIFAFAAQAWNIMSGYTGSFSFGHAAFFGAGAYSTQALLAMFGLNPWIGLLVGGVVASILGFIIGYLSFRTKLTGHYFALATLAFSELVRSIVVNMHQLNGSRGYIRPAAPAYAEDYGILAMQFQNELPYFYLILSFVILITILSWAIKNSWFGLYLLSLREDEIAAESIGIPVFRYKLAATVLSAGLTAFAGAFWSMYVFTTTPETALNLFVNADILIPALIGGMGTVLGPILGSLILNPLSELIRVSVDIGGVNRIIFSLALIYIMVFMPHGLVKVNLREPLTGFYRAIRSIIIRGESA